MTVVYWIHRKSHHDAESQGYVGISNWFRGRKYMHKRTLKDGVHKNPKLQNAFNKYKTEIVIDVIYKGPLDECIEIGFARARR